MAARRKNSLKIKSGKHRDSKKWLIGAVIFAVIAGSMVAGYFLAINMRVEKVEKQRFETLDLKTDTVSEKQVKEYTVAPERPRYLKIPSAGVDKARILEVGVNKPNADGNQQMDAPKNINDTGWYNCQVNPIAKNRCATPKVPGDGNTKTATLMDGHTCFSRNQTCVFDRISSLKNGDSIIIERGDGKELTYKVRQVEVLELKDVDMKKAMKPIETGREGLTLITCAGTYKGAIDANGVQTASQRVLVYAAME